MLLISEQIYMAKMLTEISNIFTFFTKYYLLRTFKIQIDREIDFL